MKITFETPKDDEDDEIIVRCRKVDSDLMSLLRSFGTEKKTLNGYIDNNIALLSYDDVYYFEAVENHVYAYCKSDVYEVKYKLYELEENCRSMDFIRCSKSLIVNISKIKYLSPMFNGRLEALLKNEEKVIISRQYVPELRRKLGI